MVGHDIERAWQPRPEAIFHYPMGITASESLNFDRLL
jgi:hypothetical protein